ncbi:MULTISPECIES: pathogenicity island protein [Staphylococcus]|uniref:pathogenicity island protein n=1 Tax=Staphylococcus TaxID=1279 RepID=UPI00061A3971|nr:MULTISPECIES: pathogenicity island protein [Staphylococcus]AKC76799.1 mobile element-associated protein [Staphylococcus haemolyticus]MCH4484947.1 pathogenicity island protein [Staphylococcus haemolyticus]MCH4498904.1 pathogenicity island protein [Staphylococcus haemolyticus]MCH4527216.1 pathogenicity island protein [Staphylococcus haemolyticus]MDU0497893.1 pathogenicity island protein [Staphylococcus haemolyticus]
MKTAKYFDEYNEYVTGQRENINKIENERQELSQRIEEDKAKYKELIANSQDDEADALYTTFDSNEKKLKALEKRLSTKKEVFDEARRKKAIELIKHQADLPHLYKKDKERILAKFEPIVEEYNKVVDEIAALNDEYEYEFYRFVKPYDKENFEKDKEVRAEIKNHFSPNKYSNYVSGDELPFIDIRNKMQLRGAK